MAHPLLYSNTADRLLSALCDTLLHSLWQGIILAAIAGLIVICTRKASSALRYNLLVSALLLFAIGVGATFAWQYGSRVPAIAAIGPMPHINGNVAHFQPQPVRVFVSGQQVHIPGFNERWSTYLSDHHDAIVFIWFLIVCARSLQLAFGLYGTYRLRKVRVFAADGNWTGRLQQLADNLKIKQAVRLLESGLAKVPMVIGHLKPVVLVPVGLRTALSADEVEAILIHELAHIKRRDYLVNMLQSLVEIVLFFNPAVLWVSKLIKTERENCCDDLALAQNNNKLSYIRALVSCEEYQASVPAYAMGFPGGKNTLLNRVKRMATNRNYSLNLVEKAVLAICLVVLGLGVSAFTAREQIHKVLKSVVAAIHHETAVSKTKTAIADTTKKKHTAPPNDATILLNQLQLLHPDTLRLNGNAQLNLINHNIDSLLKLNGSPLNLQSGGANLILSQLAKPDTLVLAQLMKNDANAQLLALAKPDTNGLKKLIAMNPRTFKTFQDIGLELYREHIITDTNHLGISLDEHKLIVNGKRMPQDVHDRIYKKYGREGENGSYSSNYTDNNARFASDDKTNNIISDMMKGGIITSTDDLSFKIGTTEFVVNYKKQPDAIYQKYRAKYVPAHKKGDWIWFYKFDTEKWERMTGRKNSADFEGTATGVFQGKEDGNSGGYKTGYSGGYNEGDYYHQNESQKKYWDGQQRKIIDQMAREGLTSQNNVSFTLTEKTFVINGIVQSGEVFQRYRDEYVPADAKDNWTWSYNGPGSYPTDAYRGRDWDAYSRQMAADRQRVEAERDKKLVADLLQDGLITDPNNVTFSLSDKKLMINGKKQSDEIYNKYKDKYQPNNTGSGWNWTYSHHE